MFFIAARDHIRDVMSELRKVDKPYKRIMIAGGGNIGERLASSIDDIFQIKLIAINERPCEALAEKLNYATVLHGDASDQDMLLD